MAQTPRKLIKIFVKFTSILRNNFRSSISSKITTFFKCAFLKYIQYFVSFVSDTYPFVCQPSLFLQTGTRIYGNWMRVAFENYSKKEGTWIWLWRIFWNSDGLNSWTATVVSFRERSIPDLAIQMHRKVFKCNVWPVAREAVAVGEFRFVFPFPLFWWFKAQQNHTRLLSRFLQFFADSQISDTL